MAPDENCVARQKALRTTRSEELQQLRGEYAQKLADVERRYKVASELNETLSDRIQKKDTELNRLRAEYESYYVNQLRSLEEKVFQLAGGIEYASDDKLEEMHKRAFSVISDKVPTLFGMPDLKNSLQRKAIEEHSNSDFEVLEMHGLHIYYSMCESWTFRCIWTHIQCRFCLGLEDGLGKLHPRFHSRGEDLGEAIFALGEIIHKRGNSHPGKGTHSRAFNVWLMFLCRCSGYNGRMALLYGPHSPRTCGSERWKNCRQKRERRHL